MERLTVLRATAQRLSTTPVEDLPRIAGFLASSIASCGAALQDSTSKSGDNTVPLHKLRTRLSSLLQDKTSGGRLTAAVVIKTYVEAAPASGPQWESWARGLTACLSKQDPWEAKRIYLSTIVRIFLLCQHSSQLQREVSTPLLPAFITATLSVVRPQSRKSASTTKTTTSPILPCVLHCWEEILQCYGNTLRPFVNRIKPICLSILSETNHSSHLQELAAQVLASLHLCVPKSSASAEWDSVVVALIKASHNTLDQVFRGVLENWEPNDPLIQRPSIRHDYSKVPKIENPDMVGLWPWQSIHSGILRVTNLLRWIRKMFDCASQQANVPFGLLMDLLARIMSITMPEMSNITQYPTRLNPEVGKEEREELWANLPEIHVWCLRLCNTLVLAFGQSIFPAFRALGDQALDLFDAEKWHPGVRLASYRLVISLLHTSGSVSQQLNRQTFQSICASCCLEISRLIQPEPGHEKSNGDTKYGGANGILKSSTPTSTTGASVLSGRTQSPVVIAAQDLLVALLDRVPAVVFPSSLRAEIDRAAILAGHEVAIYASVMNPPAPRTGQSRTPSLIPFLTQVSGSWSLHVEALTRPRMPTVPGSFQRKDDEEEMETEDTRAATSPGSGGPFNHYEPKDDHPRRVLTEAKNGQTLPVDRPEASLSDNSFTELDDRKKRHFAAMQASDITPGPETISQPSKKPRNDGPEPLELSRLISFGAVESNYTEPQLVKDSEGITSFGNPSVQRAMESAPVVSPFAAGADEDSDDSEIPAINAQLAPDLDEEEAEDDEEVDEP